MNNTQVQMIAVAEIDFGQRLRNPDAASVEVFGRGYQMARPSITY
ncbi:hypothetical protein [Abyssibius alkaniclasticus]